MELDDQLAALAAGELDDAAARALRARAAAEPALAARLARFERLETVLRADAGPVAMDPAAVRRADAAFDEALAALPDGPLLGAGAATSRTPASNDTDGRVVHLSTARTRRSPRWVAGVAAAAAVLAGAIVVGPGVLGGGGDDAAEETFALDSADEGTQRMDGDESAATTESAPTLEAESEDNESAPATGADAPSGGTDAGDASADDAGASEQDGGGTTDDGTLAGVTLQPYDGDDAALARLLGAPEVGDARSSVDDDGAGLDARRREQQTALAEAGDAPLVRCAATALDLEQAGALVLLGTGSHDGVEASVAVLVRPDRSAVALALADDGCAVLGRAED